LEVIRGRFPETLGDVYDMPVRERVGLPPIGGVTVELGGQFQQERIAGDVVEPIDAGEIVAAPAVLPVVLEKLFVRDGHLPSEIPGQEGDNARIVGGVIIGLQYLQHQHLRHRSRRPRPWL